MYEPSFLLLLGDVCGSCVADAFGALSKDLGTCHVHTCWPGGRPCDSSYAITTQLPCLKTRARGAHAACTRVPPQPPPLRRLAERLVLCTEGPECGAICGHGMSWVEETGKAEPRSPLSVCCWNGVSVWGRHGAGGCQREGCDVCSQKEGPQSHTHWCLEGRRSGYAAYREGTYRRYQAVPRERYWGTEAVPENGTLEWVKPRGTSQGWKTSFVHNYE